MTTILHEITDLGVTFVTTLSTIFGWLATPISQIGDNTFLRAVLDLLTGGVFEIFVHNYGELSAGSFFFGSTLTLILVYNLIKWVVGIVTGS